MPSTNSDAVVRVLCLDQIVDCGTNLSFVAGGCGDGGAEYYIQNKDPYLQNHSSRNRLLLVSVRGRATC